MRRKKGTFQFYRNLFLILAIVVFSLYVGLFFAKGRMEEVVFERDQRVLKLQRENRKSQWILKASLIIRKMNYRISDQAIITIVETAWNQSEFYKMPQSKDLFLACADTETRFNNYAVGEAGERTFVQFMPSTYRFVAGKEMTEENIQDIKHITEQWFKLIALYTFTYYDNEKVFIAYNCGERLLRYFDDTKKIKEFVYVNRNREYYPERILMKYDKYRNYLLK